MQDPIQLDSGAFLTVQVAPFAAGTRLLKVVSRELSQVRIELDAGLDLANIGGKDVNTLKNVAFQLIQSEQVESALAACMEKCLYNGNRITPATWEPENARQDYLLVAWEVMKANLRPFVKNLGSLLSTGAKAASDSPKSE